MLLGPRGATATAAAPQLPPPAAASRLSPPGGMPALRQWARRCLTPQALLAAAAAAVYLNSLAGQFVFDDHYAVVDNRDVSDPSRPMWQLFHNDFWGNDLQAVMSNKSYRPLTILGFRLQHRLSKALFGDRRLSNNVSPLPFHACNVMLHALVTVLVFQLARRLVAARWRGVTSASSPGGSNKGAAPSSWPPATLEPFLAALLFALHPVHTEAVAGIVGQAELLCAALSIPALLCYMAAADGRVASLRAHWGHVAAAVLLGWAAALTKEIGITIMGSMICYDALVAPMAWSMQQGAMASKRHKSQQGKRKPSVVAGRTIFKHTEAGSTAMLDVCRHGLCLKLLRIFVAAVGVGLYVKARSLLAGDQLVRIYSKSENPIPFAADSLTRKLTAGYVHSRYAGLLVAPLQLSADWSYACIDFVTSLSDPRNLATLALYFFLLLIGLAARPWDVLREWAGRKPQLTQIEHERRWRLAVTAGLLVGPFFPASNVLFYVGTFIGERLLYFPSVGYCILLAQPLATLLQLLSNHVPTGAAFRSQHRSALWPKGAAVLLAVLLCFFTAKTVTRNQDWRDDMRLFQAAEKVCPRSTKVQLNLAVIARALRQWEKAEMHLRLANATDPTGFCELNFHMGLTLLERDAAMQANGLSSDHFLLQAVDFLEKGVSCTVTTLAALHYLIRSINLALQRLPAQSQGLMERWGAVLARPELQRFAEVATYFENAALKSTDALQAKQVLDRARAILAAGQAHTVPTGATYYFPAHRPSSPQLLSHIMRCLEARTPLLVAIVASRSSESGLQGQQVKLATHRYLEQHGAACRTPVHAPGTDPEHTVELHKVVVHMLLEANPADPRLRQEWALTLAVSGQEAAVHLETGTGFKHEL